MSGLKFEEFFLNNTLQLVCVSRALQPNDLLPPIKPQDQGGNIKASRSKGGRAHIFKIQKANHPPPSRNKKQPASSMSTKPRLEGKVALITGAASGIGEEAARLFAENGASVVIADVQDESGHQVIASIGSNKVSYRHCDVRDEKQVEETVKFTLEKYGNLDILFSNAGIIGPLTGILDLDIEGLDNTMATNVRGVAATIKHSARAMVANKTRGSIICTTSVAACLGGAGPHAYTVSKHALVGLVRTACSELGAYGIRVNCISPFGIATPLSCKAYNLEPNEVEANSCALANLKGIVLKARHVAEAALFLASDEAAYVSGHNLTVDGGFTVVNQSSFSDS